MTVARLRWAARRANAIVLVAFAVFAVAWFRLLLDPASSVAGGRWTLFALGLVPIVGTIILASSAGRVRFVPVAIASLAMLLGLRTALHPVSPDVAFHVAKTMWAADGRPLIDPVLGINSAYPPAFHWIWGAVSRITGTTPIALLRFVSMFNFVGLCLVVWSVFRKWIGRHEATVALFVLALFRKDISEVLLASPGSFSMPFAICGWYLWSLPIRSWKVWSGAASLTVAIILWPTHLFSVIGVALTGGWRHRAGKKEFIYLGLALVAFIADLWMRLAVNGGTAWTGLHLKPPHLALFILDRLIALATLGTQSYGWVPGLAAMSALASFLFLAWIGRDAVRERGNLRGFGKLGLGLLAGAVLSGWLMPTGAHLVRLEFVACAAILPHATMGLLRLQRSTRSWPVVRSAHWCWAAALSLAWLLPVLAAVCASTERLNQWHTHAQSITEYLTAHAERGDRLCATPAAFRSVVLGRVPIFGFAAHSWPRYFSAPPSEAERLARASQEILTAPSPDSVWRALDHYHVDWVITETTGQARPGWMPSDYPELTVEAATDYYTLWRFHPDKQVIVQSSQ